MSTETDCSICYESIVASMSGRAEMTCGHTYHLRCISDWLTSAHGARSCPLCRREATSHEVPTSRSAGPLSNLNIRNTAIHNRRRRVQDWLYIDNRTYMAILENNRTPEYLTHIWNALRDSDMLLNLSNLDLSNLLENNRESATENNIWNQLRHIIIQEANTIPTDNVHLGDDSMIAYNYA